MSSPLSMLKKTRRVPLQGSLDQQQGESGRVPFKDSLTRKYEEIISGRHLPSVSQPGDHVSISTSNTSSKTLSNGIPPSDYELMSSMMQRLACLERTLKTQAHQIECKDKRISVLEEKLRLLKNTETTSDLTDKDDLVDKCSCLQAQVHEMERFLSEYGMIWVGDGDVSKTTSEEEAEDHEPTQRQSSSDRDTWQPASSAIRSFQMNFDLVVQSIQELNILAGEGESFVQATAKGRRAHLARKTPIPLRLYSNGIVMFDGPFRSYQEHSTQQCMQDLMDGYFPSELQQRFPDGVPFEVHDRREEEFVVRRPWAEFPGKGQSVDGAAGQQSPNTVPSVIPGRKTTMDQFLNKLPKVVVKAGRVIDIRDSVQAVLQGQSDIRNSVILVETPVLRAMKERLEMCDSERPPSARDVTTLRVKSEDGESSYILKMRFSETIGHLRQHLDKHRGTGVMDYDIISVFPQRRYDDNSHSLLSYGLTPNAALLLRTKISCPQTDRLTN